MTALLHFRRHTKVLFLLFLGVAVTHHHFSVTAECVVRTSDCSYWVQVPLKSYLARTRSRTEDGRRTTYQEDLPPHRHEQELFWLKGTPVRILQQTDDDDDETGVPKWTDLTCHNVTEVGPSQWELNYDVLTLRLQNTNDNEKEEDACLLSYTTNRDITVGVVGGNDNPFSTFPSFVLGGIGPGGGGIDASNATSLLLEGRLSWHGVFMQGQISQGCSTGTRGGPCVLYNLDDPVHGTAVVLSPLDHFLTTTLQASERKIEPQRQSNFSIVDGRHLLQDGIVWGGSTMSSIKVIPSGYTHSFVVVVGQDGITDTVHQWGTLLQNHYQLQRRTASDVTLQTLGYQTDNGGQYCYCQENCDQALLDVLEHLIEHQKVPVRYLSYQNAWWSTTWSAPWCVSDWEQWNARKVPMGVPEFTRRVGLPLQLYAPYFCNDTVYAKNFTFLKSNVTSQGGPCESFHCWY
jgi:hypothetical protein